MNLRVSGYSVYTHGKLCTKLTHNKYEIGIKILPGYYSSSTCKYILNLVDLEVFVFLKKILAVNNKRAYLYFWGKNVKVGLSILLIFASLYGIPRYSYQIAIKIKPLYLTRITYYLTSNTTTFDQGCPTVVNFHCDYNTGTFIGT
jgi:hypothetical protein